MPSVNPKSSLSSPEKKRRPTIGFLNKPIGNPVHNRQWLGSIDAARKYDANLILFPGDSLRIPNGFDAQANLLYDLIRDKQLDGLIILTGALDSYVTPQEMKAFVERFRPLPIVSIEVALEGIPSIMMDNYKAMRAVVAHLIEVHGYRKIAFIRGPAHHFGAQERYRAYTEALAEFGIPLDPNLVTPPDERWACNVEILLDERKLRPREDIEAVVAVSDGPALMALAEFQARGIRVPNDIAVVGFDDFIESSAVTPPLTSVRPPFYEMGWQAVEMVLALLRDEAVPEQSDTPSETVVRQSCGCASQVAIQAARSGTPGGVEKEHKESQSFEKYLAKRREAVITAMVDTLGKAEEAPGWAARLLDGLTIELERGAPGVFLHELDEVLRQAIAAGRDMLVWQNALSVLRLCILPALVENADMLSQADDLWQQARVVIGEVAQRAQMYQKIQAERQAQTLRNIGQALITTFDVKGLMDILAKELPQLGIPSAYLSLYQNPETPVERSRLIMAYNEQGRVSLEPGGLRFPSPQLVPDGLWPQERPYNYVVEPLYFREDQIGFALGMFMTHCVERSAVLCKGPHLCSTWQTAPFSSKPRLKSPAPPAASSISRS
jgi:DNA-binding LacI/PurR family transcriptional regulator